MNVKIKKKRFQLESYGETLDNHHKKCYKQHFSTTFTFHFEFHMLRDGFKIDRRFKMCVRASERTNE